MPDFAGIRHGSQPYAADILEKGPKWRLGQAARPSPVATLPVATLPVATSPVATRPVSRGDGFVEVRPVLLEPVPVSAPREPRAEAPRCNRRRRDVLTGVVASATVTVAVAVALAVVAAWRDDDTRDRPRAPEASTTEPAEPTLAPGGFIDSVESDSEPVGPDEFFRNTQVVAADGRTYTRVARRLDAGCPGIRGQGPGAVALGGDRCRQLVRAVYVSEDGGPAGPTAPRVAVSVAVVVTDSQASAAQAVASGTVITVPPPQLPAGLAAVDWAAVDWDDAWTTASTQGHYLARIAAAFTDGSGLGADRHPLRAAANDLRLVAVAPVDDRAAAGAS